MYYDKKNQGFKSDREGDVRSGSVCNIDLEIDCKGTYNREEAWGRWIDRYTHIYRKKD